GENSELDQGLTSPTSSKPGQFLMEILGQLSVEINNRANVSDHNAAYSREVINAFLECLDGAEARTGVVVVGATNHPELIDPAIRRAGRLDRHLHIPLPDEKARAGILRHHLRRELISCDLGNIPRFTEGMTGADIEQLVRNARRTA
ncbi:ATP-binding protein, partial [Aureimonas sp. Leaf454]|uniref:AAA family ATPase n=1 Tax=Aureimonas sp. Leaf454 TaxID=1736381 RepID=UPI000A96B712